MAKQSATEKVTRQPRANAAAKPAAKADRQAQTQAGIFVRSFPPTFRRAGFEFTQAGYGLLLQDLSKAQVKAIRSEPLLHVTDVEVPVTEADDELLQLEHEGNGTGNSTEPPATNETPQA